MCGFVGTNHNLEGLSNALELIKYRGPDNSSIADIKLNNAAAFRLGHNRLSFLDLSDNASQPLTIDGVSIVFNGEIYNYQTIRAELLKLGWTFCTTSDTEVILTAYRQWGLNFVSKLEGMFAFSIIDKYKSKCLLVRDRFGVKPLYYYKVGEVVIFASEIQCIKALVDIEIDKTAIGQFLKYGYVLQPKTIYENVKQVSQGSCIEIDLVTNAETHSVYWTTEEEYKIAIASGRSRHLEIEKFDKLMRSAVSARMIADVEIGVCLSGGYDSSICAKLAADAVSYQIDTFTIGFENKDNDESKYAHEFSEFIGAKNYQKICKEVDSEQIIKKILRDLGEPLADSSIIPTYQLFKLVMEKNKAAISADGGDELFAGYNKYNTLRLIRSLKFLIPALPMLELLCGKDSRLRQKLQKIKKYRNCTTASDFMNKSREVFSDEEIQSLIGTTDVSYLNPKVNRIGKFLDQLQLHDVLYYQQNSILVKIDRMSMLNSVEAREPFLNADLQKYGYSLTPSVKSTLKNKKIPLKRYSKFLFGADILNRPKRGFGSPVKTWINGILSEDVTRILGDRKLSKSLGLKQSQVNRIVQEHALGDKDYKKLWHLYVLYTWAEQHGN